MSGVGVTKSDIPPHVPAHLVREWALATAPGVETDPYSANKVLLSGPPIFYSPLMKSPIDNGAWVITRGKLIREALQRPDLFENKNCSGLSLLAGGGDWCLIPLEKDPPEHTAYRMVLNPLFGPGKLNAMEGEIRRVAVELIERFRSRGSCEFDRDFGRPFPASIFLNLLGLPLDMTDQFVEWELTMLRAKTFEQRAVAAKAVREYLATVIQERRRAPKDDLISFTVGAQINGRPLNDDEAMGICYLMFVGGLDTVTSTLGFTFKHLAENPENQIRLRNNPELIPAAIEELLRAHAVVNSPRHVAQDMTFHGIEMKKGDRVVLAMTIAGRDPDEFDDPDAVDFEREAQRHISFAAGPHVCIGQHLARREIRVALEEWIARIPIFEIEPGKKPVTQGMTVFSVDYLPLRWPS